MLVRYNEHRKHIINSLDTLLYQLHTLSFLLAPSVLAYLCRCATQFQFSQAREVDKHRSLTFWYFMVLFVNAGSVWSHAVVGYPEGKGLVLDFVGIGRKPSKAQLLLLDFTIIFLQWLLATISYETSLSAALSADIPDPLIPNSLSPPLSPITENTTPSFFRPSSLPASTAFPDQRPITYPPTPALTPPLPSSSPPSRSSLLTKRHSETALPLPPSIPIINLTFRHIIHRLTKPAPEPTEEQDLERQLNQLAMQLPLPNTTATRLSQTLRLLAQTRARLREMEETGEGQGGRGRGRGGRSARGLGDSTRRVEGGQRRNTRIPGAIEEEDSDSD